MSQELTVWVTPFTSLRSLDDALAKIDKMVRPAWHANLLIPLHYGKWPQAECIQSIPADMLVKEPDDVALVRQQVEHNGFGFGGWGVPHNGESAELAGQFAEACGYYSANFEPDVFWTLGDDPAAIDDWWSRFWNAMQDQEAMAGNVSATVVPNGWGLGAFSRSLPNLAAGCGALALEVYGGLQTKAEYPAPKQADWIARDFKFHSGETTPELRLHYTTVGEPGRSAGVGAARLRRLGREHADARIRRRNVRSRPAARRFEILHHHSGRHRPRQILKALRWHEDRLPEI